MVVSDLIIACYVLWPGVPYRQQSWHTSQHAKPWRMWLGTTVTGDLVAMPTLFLEGGGSEMGAGKLSKFQVKLLPMKAPARRC